MHLSKGVIKALGVGHLVPKCFQWNDASRYWSKTVFLLIPVPAEAAGHWCVSWLSWFNHGCPPANRPLDPDISKWKQIANFAGRACWVGWCCCKQIACLCPCRVPAITVPPQQCLCRVKDPSRQVAIPSDSWEFGESRAAEQSLEGWKHS